jgi:hypothetical protein
VTESFRIGFDLDGVLADLASATAAVAGRLPGAGTAPLPSDDPDSDTGDAAEADPGSGLETDPGAVPDTARAAGAGADAVDVRRSDPGLTRDIWHEIRATENFWETLNEIESGAVARLAALAEEHRWEVVFLTQRPSTRGDTTQRQSQRWLAGLGFMYPSVCVVNGSRGRVAEALGLHVVVDDRPENCVDVVTDSKATAVLIWRGGQHSVVRNARRMGIEVTDSVGDCLDRLAAGFISPNSRGGIVGRVRRWLDSSSRLPG